MTKIALLTFDPDFQYFFEELGEMMRYEIKEAPSIDTKFLVGFIKDGEFDIVIQDFMIPDKESGYNLYLELRTNKELFRFPMLMFTNLNVQGETLRPVMMKRNKTYIDYPLDIKEVANRIEEVLEGIIADTIKS